MPQLNRIYTKTGDRGETALGGGRRVAKDDRRLEAYGTVDELNSLVGLALSLGVGEPHVGELRRIQHELFRLGSDLCFLEEDKTKWKIPTMEERHVLALEESLDRDNEALGPLENFILPGGTATASALHVARTVCRRAERVCVRLAREQGVGEWVVKYLNRLSDYLFLAARMENRRQGVSDPLWESRQ